MEEGEEQEWVAPFFSKLGKLNAVRLRVTQRETNFSGEHKRDVSTSRRCPLDTCHLLKKVDENFAFV